MKYRMKVQCTLEVVGGRQAETNIKKIESLDSFPTIPTENSYLYRINTVIKIHPTAHILDS